MTNEEKVEQYFKEIEGVFGTRGGALNILNSYDKLKELKDLESVDRYNNTMLGVHQKEYWVKFKVSESNLLNSFLMRWVCLGKKIAGVQGSTLDFGGIVQKEEFKEELKKKLYKMLKEL